MKSFSHLCSCGRYGRKLNTTLFLKVQRKLIICAKKSSRMKSVESRGEGPIDPPPLMPSCNYFRPIPSRVKQTQTVTSGSGRGGNRKGTELYKTVDTSIESDISRTQGKQ